MFFIQESGWTCGLKSKFNNCGMHSLLGRSSWKASFQLSFWDPICFKKTMVVGYWVCFLCRVCHLQQQKTHTWRFSLPGFPRTVKLLKSKKKTISAWRQAKSCESPGLRKKKDTETTVGETSLGYSLSQYDWQFEKKNECVSHWQFRVFLGLWKKDRKLKKTC